MISSVLRQATSTCMRVPALLQGTRAMSGLSGMKGFSEHEQAVENMHFSKVIVGRPSPRPLATLSTHQCPAAVLCCAPTLLQQRHAPCMRRLLAM